MRSPTRVLIGGGGIGALEGLLALQHLAGDRVEIAVLTAVRFLTYRALSVAEPFGAEPPGAPHRVRATTSAGERRRRRARA